MAEELVMGTKSVTVPGGLYAWTKQFLTRVGIDIYIYNKPQPFPPAFYRPLEGRDGTRISVMPSTLGQRGKGPWKIHPVCFKHVNSRCSDVAGKQNL